MGTELSVLRTGLAERGYHYLLGNGVADQFVNSAIEDICADEDWPFMEADAGVITPPHEIADLDAVLSVHTAAGAPVPPIENWVVAGSLIDSNLGEPRAFYMQAGNQLVTRPLGDVRVRYLRSPGTLTAGSDRADIPSRWDEVILSRAEWYAAGHAKNLGIQQACESSYQAGLERMRDRLIDPQRSAMRVMFRYVGEFA